MNKLNFYHQRRKDGGVRSGVDFNGERILESFVAGEEPPDSALLWFVDVRCSGEKLPSEPESIRCWFLEHGELIRHALGNLAEELQTGMDSGWPLKREIQTREDVDMTVCCSAIRRLSGREISDVLSKLRDEWPDLLHRLNTYGHSVLAHG